MALQIWLPLDGTLENKGCLNIGTTNTSAVFTDSGKIGQVAESGRFTITCPKIANILNSVFTISFWGQLKAIPEGSSENDTYFFKCGVNGTRTCLHFAVRQTSGALAFCFYSDDYTFVSNSSSYVGVWHHFTLIFDGEYQIVYVDGNLIGKRKTGGSLQIAENSNFIIINPMFAVNDFRLYDHCLSVAEVKELSQGLILHYKLDESYPMTNKNLLKDFPKYYSKTGYNAYVLYMTEKVVEGQTYTLQFWDVDVSHTGKTESQLGISAFLGGGSWTLKTLNGTDYFTNGHADHIECSFTITSGQASSSDASKLELWIWNSVPQVSGTMSMSIGKWKLEKGDTATPYINCELSDKINPFVVTDSSGYGHHGQIVNTVSYTNDSHRYSSSIDLANTVSSYITGSCYASDTITFSLLVKFNTMKDAHVIDMRTSTEGYQPFYTYTNGTVQSGGSNSYVSFNSSFQIDRWYHVVFSYDSSALKMYVDGVNIGSSGKGSAFNKVLPFYLGTRFNQANYSDVYISDFRIYCTALSTEDILDLYHTSAKIDKTGKVHTFEFVEDEGTKITKTGITEWVELIEETGNAKFNSQYISANDFIER